VNGRGSLMSNQKQRTIKEKVPSLVTLRECRDGGGGGGMYSITPTPGVDEEGPLKPQKENGQRLRSTYDWKGRKRDGEGRKAASSRCGGS